jgi:hypothetical protein
MELGETVELNLELPGGSAHVTAESSVKAEPSDPSPPAER